MQPNYQRAIIAGIVATFVMSIAAQWVAAIGLPKADPSRLMQYSFGGSPYILGLAAHFMNGIVLALMYAKWKGRVPGGSTLMRGVVIGVATMLAAQLLVGPGVGPMGFFWEHGGLPRVATSLIAHLTFGIALTVAYDED